MQSHVLFAAQKVIVTLLVFIQKVFVLVLMCQDMCMRITIMCVSDSMCMQVRMLN